MPSILEVVVLNLMVFAYTGERLYGLEGPCTYTRCIEKVEMPLYNQHPLFYDHYPVIVGGFGSAGLRVNDDSGNYFVSVYCGVAGVQRWFLGDWH